MKKILLTVLVAVVSFSVSANAQTKKVSPSDFERTNVSEMSMEDKEAFLAGDLLVINPERNGIDTRPVHKVVASMLCGVRILDGEVHPLGTLRLGYEVPRFVAEGEGSLGRSHCAESAEYNGYYTTIIVGGNFGYKLWRDKLDYNYLSVNINAGYMFQMNDSDLAEYRNENYGLTFGIFARYSHHLAPRLKLVGEAGYKSYPQTNYWGNQKNVAGLAVNVGVSFVF